MKEVSSCAMRINQNRTAFEVQLNTANGSINVEISPTVAASLAISIVRLGAESGDAKLAQVAQHFVVEDVNFRQYNGSLVLVQETQGGFALYSSVDQQKLQDLRDQIEQLLAGMQPPLIQ